MAAPEKSAATRGSALPLPTPNALVLIINGQMAHDAGLCERVQALLQSTKADPLICDVDALVTPDVGTIDALARVQLTALRLGRRVVLRNASEELRELLALAGLCGAFPMCEELRLEPGRQAEEGEQALGIQEEADPPDPIA